MSEGRRAYDIVRGYVNREWDRIKGIEGEDAERELDDALAGPRDPASPRMSRLDDRETARRTLGVNPGASILEIQAAHDRLMERSDPSRFPEGTSERTQADAIRLRVRRAFALLTDELDGTERRFRTLEL